MKQWKVSLPIPVLLTNPMVYQFGNPILGLCFPQRIIYELKESKEKAIPITADILDWCRQIHKRKVVPVSYAYTYTNPQRITSSIAQETGKALVFAYWYLKRPLTESEMHALMSVVWKGKEVELICALQAIHGGITYSRREFAFLKQTSLLPINIPKDWSEQLSISISHKKTDWTKEIEKGRTLYNQPKHKMRQYLDEYEVLTKKIVTAITTESWELFQKSIITLCRHQFSQESTTENNLPIYMVNHKTEMLIDRKIKTAIPFQVEKQGALFL